MNKKINQLDSLTLRNTQQTKHGVTNFSRTLYQEKEDLINGLCGWCRTDELYVSYHDNEWGKPVTDDKTLFEFLVLESVKIFTDFVDCSFGTVDLIFLTDNRLRGCEVGGIIVFRG